MHGVTRGTYMGFGWESQKERHRQEDVEVGERIILKCVIG
jgi:hypothetical protein